MPDDYFQRRLRQSRYVPWKYRGAAGWEQRQRWFFHGALMALIPALASLPALVVLVLVPRFPHARILGIVLLVAFSLCEISGVIKLVRCCAIRDFDILCALAFGALILFLVVVLYTGVLVMGFVYR